MKHPFPRVGTRIGVAVAILAFAGAATFLITRGKGDASGDAPAPSSGASAALRAVEPSASTTSVTRAAANRVATNGVPVPAALPPVDPVDPPEYATALPDSQLFAPLPEARAHFARKLPFGVDDRSYVEFNRGALARLKPGATLEVRMPDDGRRYTIRVDAVEVHPNGDKSWTGRVLDGRGGLLPVVFTQGVDSSFGSISTASATYSLEAEGRLGWIANVNTLRRHQDFSRPDVFVPDPGKAIAPPTGD